MAKEGIPKNSEEMRLAVAEVALRTGAPYPLLLQWMNGDRLYPLPKDVVNKLGPGDIREIMGEKDYLRMIKHAARLKT